ncbi:MAG TPA: hypothetical protein V6C46_00660 [Coleofasciculaceae cyanobacterium]
MGSSIRPSVLAFLIVTGTTLLVWLFRGIGLLTFLPGGVLSGLILLSILAAVLTTLR